MGRFQGNALTDPDADKAQSGGSKPTTPLAFVPSFP